MKNSIYTLPQDKDIRGLAHAVEAYLINVENMNCQVLGTEQGEYIVQGQARNHGFAQWVGMDKAVTVRLTPGMNNTVMAQIGNGEWLNKGLTMTVSMFMLWPLAVSSTVGMVKQGKLPGRIERAIQMYIAGMPMGIAC